MTPLSILVADDQPINLKLLRAQLEGEGHTVFAAANGIEALEILDREPVELVISDILMPVMDGYRLCSEVRGGPHRDLPFIFYTATYTSPADEQLCLQLGADRYLRKPVALPELLAAIDEVLATSRPRAGVIIQGQDVLKEYSERLIFKLEQKNLELAAASDQLRLQATALDTAAEAILITDVEGMISWVNRAFCAATGFSADGAIGMTVAALDVGLPVDAFHGSFWQSRGELEWHGESVIRHENGAVRHEEMSVTPVRAADGTITHLVGVLHDVTDRRKAERELRDAHAKLRQILEHSPAVLYALRVEGEKVTPVLVSENITRLLGFQVDETVSERWWLGQLHPEDRTRALASVRETITEGVSRTEYRLRHLDGTYHWVEDNRRLVRDPLAGTTELVGVWSDITDRKRAQDELRETDRRFRVMLDNLELVSIMLDTEARLTYCNDYFLRLTGWRREEVIGRDWFQLFVPPEQVDELRRVYLSLLADLPEAWHYTNELLTRSGERRLVQWNNSLLRSPSGEVIGTASVAEDITDRKNLERQILRAQRLESLGTLAGGIAHDMNNLLMPILMGVTLLRRLGQDERGLKAIDNIERSVKRGSDLVKHVLLFARGVQATQATVNLGEIVREVEAIATSTFPRNITFEVSVAGDLSRVTGDVTQLTQVLLNLCVNARDAMPRGGRIRISATNESLTDHYARLNGGTVGGPHVVLEVADTGEGMPKETIERIFDPFFTTKEFGKGTGLGLSTVQGIVGSHGGFISVSSAPGEGSSFRVHLPVIGVVPTAATPTPDAEELPQGQGELILVVDDDASVVSMTRQTLELFGYDVLTAEDGAQAIGLFARRQADISAVVTDMVMPVIDGPALIAALMRIDPDVRIIAVTGDSSPSVMSRISRTDVVEILAKPYRADRLLRTLAGILRKGGQRPLE